MKKLFFTPLLTVLLLSLQSCGVITIETKPIVKVVSVEDATKNELYVRANNWMVSAFNNGESVIQFTDKESGTITGKYSLGIVKQANKYGPARRAFAIIHIQVKDEASKITITPESFSYSAADIYMVYDEEEATENINVLITSFEQAIIKKEDTGW